MRGKKFGKKGYLILLLIGLCILPGMLFAQGGAVNPISLFLLNDTVTIAEKSLLTTLESFNFDPDSLVINGQPDFDVVDWAMQKPHILAQFLVPVSGKVISKFGYRHGRLHTGTDVKLNLGDTVLASYDGIVTKAQRYYGYGALVVLNHPNGLETYYAHLSSILVNTGDTIRKGQPVGLGGHSGRATTNHLHFEIRENKKPYNSEYVFNYEEGIVRPEAVAENSMADLFRFFNSVKEEISPITHAAATPFEYVVKAGDSLWLIARRFQTPISTLCRINNITTSSVLKIGSVLKLHEITQATEE